MDNTVVTWQRPDHPHNSAEFAAHTGLTHVYPKYMVGGGYVISADCAKMIVITQQLVSPLLHTQLSLHSRVTSRGADIRRVFVRRPCRHPVLHDP